MDLVHSCVISTWILDENSFLLDHPVCEKIQGDQTVTETEIVT